MSIKPWNEKTLWAEPTIWDATAELDSAVVEGEGKLYQTEGEKTYKSQPRHIKPIWIEGDKCGGKSTRHFAWAGLPKEVEGGKVPGVVLVHGGGGTAFLRWVDRWTRRGYAAIAVDTCGHLPVATEYGKWAGHAHAPSWTHGDFENADKPAKEQWCYHAVTAVVRAHSHLRSWPQVDKRKVGITGVSWGGYLTSIVSSVDSRFRFAAPVYGCGFLDHDSPWGGELEKIGSKNAKRWLKLWDPKQYLPNSTVPTLWATGSNDFAYHPDMLDLSSSVCGAKTLLSVHIRYSHSHNDGWKLSEPYAFADSFCRGAARLTSPKVRVKDRRIDVAESGLAKAVLCYTEDTGNWPERFWKQISMKRNSAGRFSAELPTTAIGWFVNSTDENRNQITSQLHIKP